MENDNHVGETYGIYTLIESLNEKDKYGHYLYKGKCKESDMIIYHEILRYIESENKSKDYTLYIFCVILLIVLLLGYFIFKKIINKNNDEMDD